MSSAPSRRPADSPASPLIVENPCPSPEDSPLDPAPRRKPRRPFRALVWWVLFLLFALYYYHQYSVTAFSDPRYGINLYNPDRIGVNVPDRGDVLKNVLAIGGRLFGIGHYEGPFFKDGWRGYDFNGLDLTACVLRRSGGKQPIYPDFVPKDLKDFQKWSEAVGEKYAKDGDLNYVSNGAYLYPPIDAVLLLPWAGRGPNGLFDLWIRFTRVLVVALWVLCIWIAWRAYGRSDPIDWLVVAAMIAFNYPLMWGLVECSNASIAMACLTTAGLLLLLKPWDWQTGLIAVLLILWVYGANSGSDTLLTAVAGVVVVAVLGVGLYLFLRGHAVAAGLLLLVALAILFQAVAHYRAIPNLVSLAILFFFLGTGVLLIFQRGYGASSVAFGLALAFVLLTRGGIGIGEGLFLGGVAGAGVYLILRTRDWLFGLVFALAIQLKISPIIFLPWLLMRRRARPFATTIVFSVMWLVIALYGAGLEDHIRFVRTILPWVGRGEVFWPNQSLNGLIQRWMEPGRSMFVLTTQAAPAGVALITRAVSVGTITLAYVVLFFLRRRRPTAHRVALEYSLLLVAGMAASPVSWEHHYTSLLVVWVILYAALRYHLTGWRRWIGLALFCAGWTLNARFFAVWQFPQHLTVFAEDWGLRWLLPYVGPLARLFSSYQVFSLFIAAALILMAHAPTPAERKAASEAALPDYKDWDSIRPCQNVLST